MNVHLCAFAALLLLCGCVAPSDPEPAECETSRDCPEEACRPSGCDCLEGHCVARCGDGAVHAGEECDDGNALHDDGCTPGCVAERCGDAIVQEALGEACDPPGTATCSSDCQPIACGDGRLDPPEACEAGGEEPACNPSTCGCDALDVCAGREFAVALRSDGRLLWFGLGDPGLGAPPLELGAGRPALLEPRLDGPRRLACTRTASRFTALDEATGELQLFEPEAGRLGPEEVAPVGGRIAPPDGERWAEVVGGGDFFALRSSGDRVFLLTPSESDLPATPRTPTELPGRFTALAAGGTHLLLLGVDGRLFVLGSSIYGALGLLGSTRVTEPTEVPGLAGCDRVGAAEDSSYVRCSEPLPGCTDVVGARDDLGQLPSCTSGPAWLGFGFDGYGDLGLTDPVSLSYAGSGARLGLWDQQTVVPRPHPMLASPDIERFVGSHWNVLAIDVHGDVFALGNNFRGQPGEHGNPLGVPDTYGEDRNEWNFDSPKAVPGLPARVRSAAVSGRYASLLVMEDGTIAASGESCMLRLGLGAAARSELDASNACRPDEGRCFIDADRFTTFSLCAREPIRYDLTALSCGRP